MEEVEEGRIRSLPCPRNPTKKEIEEHEISHTPFRAWCRFCGMGRGEADPHRRHADEEKLISCDYCFMGRRPE